VTFALKFTRSAADRIRELDAPEQVQVLRATLQLLEGDPGRPELRSHKYTSVHGINGEEVWESLVADPAEADWRMFWHYGPEADTITVASITSPK
jgi:hypothetical protein